MRARLIKADGNSEPIDLPSDDTVSMMAILHLGSETVPESLVLVELADGRPGLTLWHNPAALFDDTSKGNRMAWKLATWVMAMPSRCHVAGDAILTGAIGAEGDVCPITQAQDEVIASMLAKWGQEAERITTAEATAKAAGAPMFASTG